MRVVYLAFLLILAVALQARGQAVVQSQPAVPGHVACWAGNGAVMDCGNGSGNFITDWPAIGDVVISNQTNAPAGIAPSTNGCLASQGGVWTIATCGGGGGSGNGTVTSVSIATANGFSGSVANATTTPLITLSTATSGLLKGVSGALQAAIAGTDYLTPTGVGSGLTGFTYTQLPALSANQVLGAATASTPISLTMPSCSGGANALIWTLGVGFGCNTISAGGTVTAITPGAGLAGTSNPITTSGTISLATQSANTVLAALSAGTPTAIGVPPCSGTNNALNWTSGTGFGCVTVAGSGAGTPAVQDFLANTNFTPGTTTGLTLASTPSVSAVVSVFFDGVHQSADTWTLSGAVITFSAAIPLNVQVVEVQWVLASGSGGGGITSITAGTGLSGGTITSSGTISLAAVSPNTVLGAVSSGAPTPLSMPSCSTSTSALIWTANAGFGCNTNAGGGGSSGITINTSTITNGVSGYILYNNGGLVGNATLASFLTSPPAIGTTAPAVGNFTALSATSVTGGGFSNFLASTGPAGLLTQPVGGGWWWDGGQVVYNATETAEPWEFVSGTIASVTTYTGGTTPSFTVGFYINGTGITGCTGIVVTSSTPTKTNCTGANTITQGQYLTAVITSTSGTPQSALVSYAGTRTNY